MGGRRTLDNGRALCLRCRSQGILPKGRIRFNFSVPESTALVLNEYCADSGRSVNDVAKQLMADYIYGNVATTNGHLFGDRNVRRVAVSVLYTVYELFTSRCAAAGLSPREAMKSLIYCHLRPFSEGKVWR